MLKSFVYESCPSTKLEPGINGLISVAAQAGFTKLVDIKYIPLDSSKKIGDGDYQHNRYYDIILLVEKANPVQTGQLPSKEDAKKMMNEVAKAAKEADVEFIPNENFPENPNKEPKSAKS